MLAQTAKNLLPYRAYGAAFYSDLPLDSLDSEAADFEPGPPLTLQARDANDTACDLPGNELVLNPMHGRELKVRYASLPGAGQDLPERNLEMEVVGLLRFRILSPGKLEYIAMKHCAPWQIEFWFLHVFFPIYLSLFRNGQFFHGAAVEKDGTVQAFIGPTHSGKSTITEAMLSRGYRLFADDKFRVSNSDGVFLVHPSHGRFRPYRKPEDLGFKADQRGFIARPLGRVFLLDKLEAANRPAIAPLSGSAAVSALKEQLLYQFYLSRAEGLLTAAGFAQAGMVYRLARPWGLRHLAATADHLDAWLQVP